MKTFILRLRLARAFFSLVRDPTQTEKVFFLSEKSRELPSQLLRPTLDYILNQQGFRKLYQDRYDPPIPTLKDLLSYPKGSLGFALGTHLKKNNLAIEFFPVTEGYDEADYILRRVRRTHDIWHVLTGFDTSPAGEVGLQAFTFAQLKSPFSALIIAISILHGLDRGQASFFEAMENIFAGYRLGARARPLIGIPIEQKLEENLENLRLEFGLANEGRAYENSGARSLGSHS